MFVGDVRLAYFGVARVERGVRKEIFYGKTYRKK